MNHIKQLDNFDKSHDPDSITLNALANLFYHLGTLNHISKDDPNINLHRFKKEQDFLTHLWLLLNPSQKSKIPEDYIKKLLLILFGPYSKEELFEKMTKLVPEVRIRTCLDNKSQLNSGYTEEP